MAKPKKRLTNFMPTGSMNHPDRPATPVLKKDVQPKEENLAHKKTSLGASKPTGTAKKMSAIPGSPAPESIQSEVVTAFTAVEPVVAVVSDDKLSIDTADTVQKTSAKSPRIDTTDLNPLLVVEPELVEHTQSVDHDRSNESTSLLSDNARTDLSDVGDATAVSHSMEMVVVKKKKTRRLIRARLTAYITRRREQMPSLPKPSLRMRSATLLVTGCGLLLVGTQITLVLRPQLGIYLNMVSLLVLAGVALARVDLRKVAISIAIIPVTQMVLSTIIVTNAFERSAVFYVSLLVLTLCYRYMFTLDEPIEHSRLHWKGHLFGIPLMFMLGQVVGLVGYAFLRHHYPYHGVSLPLVAVAAVVFAFVEEMLLRGLVQQQAAKVVHPLLAAALAAALYSVLAFSHASLLTLGPAIISGVVLALVYYARRNVFLCVVVNAFSKLLYVGLVATFILR